MMINRKLFAIPLALVAAGCSVDEKYNLDKELDLSVSLFEDGVALPVGQSEAIKLGTLLNEDGQSLSELVDEGDGYHFKVEQKADFGSEIADFISTAGVKGYSIAAQNYSNTTSLSGYQAMQIKLKDLASQGFTKHAGLYLGGSYPVIPGYKYEQEEI